MSSQTGNRTADRKFKKTNYKGDNFDKNKDYSRFGDVEVRFYKPEEWSKLSVGQRNYVRQEKIKLKAGTQATAQMVSTVASLQASIQELTSRLNKNGKRPRESDDTSTTESEYSSDSPSNKRSKRVRLPTQRRG